MKDKRTLLLDEEPKHKKKSNKKGQPRSKHKHVYETVLLRQPYHGVDFKTGKEAISVYIRPTKVCTICGRIDDIDDDPMYYTEKPIVGLPFCVFDKELSDKALSLPHWETEDFFDKFATKMEN
jgi:hypothetical protein